MLAILQTQFKPSVPEITDGIIKGVRVMEKGILAEFAAIHPDGKKESRKATLTDAHLDALKNHAGNRAIAVHWTHDHAEGKADEFDSVGLLKSFRRETIKREDGSELEALLADLHLEPGPQRERVTWRATHAPDSIMLSAVYSFAPDDALCIPTSFDACDLVREGAGTTALFARHGAKAEPAKEIDFATGLVAALAKPEVAAALKAALAEPKDDKEEKREAAAIAQMKKDAGVTDADIKPEDKEHRPLLAAHMQVARATSRKAEEDRVKAQAELTAAFGKKKEGVKDEKPIAHLSGFDRARMAIRAELAAKSSN